MCEQCESLNPDRSSTLWIAKDKVEAVLADEDIENLPVHGLPDQQRCHRCGERGAELHHWAPKAIFGKDEAEHWPKDWLCPKCHAFWHQRATPNLTCND